MSVGKSVGPCRPAPPRKVHAHESEEPPWNAHGPISYHRRRVRRLDLGTVSLLPSSARPWWRNTWVSRVPAESPLVLLTRRIYHVLVRSWQEVEMRTGTTTTLGLTLGWVGLAVVMAAGCGSSSGSTGGGGGSGIGAGGGARARDDRCPIPLSLARSAERLPLTGHVGHTQEWKRAHPKCKLLTVDQLESLDPDSLEAEQRNLGVNNCSGTCALLAVAATDAHPRRVANGSSARAV